MLIFALPLENMYYNSFYDKTFLCNGFSCFPIWPTAAILDFKIQLVFFNISFSMVLWSLYAKGEIYIMI